MCSSKVFMYAKKEENVQKAIFYWNAKVENINIRNKAQKANTKKAKVSVGESVLKKVGYVIPSMNCYPRNGF